MLTFFAGMACGVLAMMLAFTWVMRAPKDTYLTVAQSNARARMLKASHKRDGIEYPWPASEDFAEAFDPKASDKPRAASRSAP